MPAGGLNSVLIGKPARLGRPLEEEQGGAASWAMISQQKPWCAGAREVRLLASRCGKKGA